MGLNVSMTLFQAEHVGWNAGVHSIGQLNIVLTC